MIYLIGDSQIRSFSFVKEIVPLFLGPSKANNFNNKKNTEKTVRKILGLISNLDRNDKVIVFLGSGHRYSAFFETPTNENLTDLLAQFEQGMGAIADSCSCHIELLTPAPPTRVFSHLYEPWVRLENGLLSSFERKERIRIHSFGQILDVKNPLDGDSVFDEIHISASTALAVTRGLLADDIGVDAWRYCETIKGCRTAGSAKIVGDIPYVDLDISLDDTLNFSLHHQDSLAVELLAGQISALCKYEKKAHIVVFEEGEGFITRCLLGNLPSVIVTSIYRNRGTMKKALAVNNICGVAPECYLLDDKEIKLNSGSICVVDGFEKLRDEYKKLLVAEIKVGCQAFLISKTPEKDSVFVTRASGNKPIFFSASGTMSKKQMLGLNITNDLAHIDKSFWRKIPELIAAYGKKISSRLT